jgi:hypothetical protein
MRLIGAAVRLPLKNTRHSRHNCRALQVHPSMQLHAYLPVKRIGASDGDNVGLGRSAGMNAGYLGARYSSRGTCRQPLELPVRSIFGLQHPAAPLRGTCSYASSCYSRIQCSPGPRLATQEAPSPHRTLLDQQWSRDSHTDCRHIPSFKTHGSLLVLEQALLPSR